MELARCFMLLKRADVHQYELHLRPCPDAGLDKNDYDRNQCQEVFDAYKNCKKEEVWRRRSYETSQKSCPPAFCNCSRQVYLVYKAY